jgi:hypothetical protein
MTATFDTFMESAWSDHADDSEGVAARLVASTALAATPAELARFAALATHVFGEHLGRWHDGVALVTSLRDSRAFDSAASRTMLDRHVATLRYAAGEASALAAVSGDDRAAALAAAASALAGRGDIARAIAAYAEARAIAGSRLADGSPAVRALAVGGNNLAATLEQRANRSAAETQSMLDAAQSALDHWRRAGTWLEEERAQYRLARSRLAAGDARGAIDAADACLAICEHNHAPPFELFFGYAALALAQRAAGSRAGFGDARTRVLALYESLPEDEREFAQADLRAIETSGAPG